MDDESDRESIRYLLMLICKLSRDRSRVLMSEIGIHCGQGIALRQLWRKDGVTQSELAHGLHVAPATVTIALQRMERIGLVERRPDKRDQRVTRVFLTDRGRSAQAGGTDAQWFFKQRAPDYARIPSEDKRQSGL